mgnify:CR=1
MVWLVKSKSDIKTSIFFIFFIITNYNWYCKITSTRPRLEPISQLVLS